MNKSENKIRNVQDVIESFTIRIPKENRLSIIDWKKIQDYVRDLSNGRIATRRRNRFSK